MTRRIVDRTTRGSSGRYQPMGEVADDMIEGWACSQCGALFLDPDGHDRIYEHGYPVLCWECWRDATKKERAGHQRAKVETL